MEKEPIIDNCFNHIDKFLGDLDTRTIQTSKGEAVISRIKSKQKKSLETTDIPHSKFKAFVISIWDKVLSRIDRPQEDSSQNFYRPYVLPPVQVKPDNEIPRIRIEFTESEEETFIPYFDFEQPPKNPIIMKYTTCFILNKNELEKSYMYCESSVLDHSTYSLDANFKLEDIIEEIR